MEIKMDIKKIISGISKAKNVITGFISNHKIPVSIAAGMTALCIIAASATVFALKSRQEAHETVSTPSVEDTVASVSSVVSEVEFLEESSLEEPSESSEPESSKPVSKPQQTSSVKKETTVKNESAAKPVANNSYKYNTNSNIDDNIFLDALIYTGYNIEKHRADGKMWQYILSANKRGLGYLSKISYGGGSSGYETLNGKPDIRYFEKHGLVCASYVTYVYFNYLPNVAGIDTSALPKPARPTSANDWYSALKQWVSKGYSRKIAFSATKTSAGFINFKPSENIPIGSVIVFCDSRNRSDYGSHVAIYAGYKNNYNWIFHVGNKNGPEFCAVERMNFGHDPQWPIAVIIPPTNIRMSALLEINVTDQNGSPVSGSALTLKNSKTGATVNLGTANGGKLSKEGLSYGDYTLSFTVPAGYTSDSTSKAIKLTTANNSKNTVSITLAAIPPAKEETPAESQEGSGDIPETESDNPPSGYSENESTD